MHKKYAQDDLGAYLAEDVKIVKKQKTKKQKPLRKNNSFRKKRKAKV